MAIKLIDELIGMRFKQGNTTYEAVEIKFRDQVLWPVGTTYQIVTPVTWHWSQGSSFYANGSNTVWFSADVRVTTGGTTTTIQDATLIPSLDSNTEYYIDSDHITVCAHNLNTTPTNEYNEQITLSYGSATTHVTIYQQANVKSAYGEPTYANYQETGVTVQTRYATTMVASSYYTSQSPCPASGGVASLSAYHDEDVLVNWVADVTQGYQYTATGSTVYYETTMNVHGSTPNTRRVDDSSSITRSAGSTAITYANNVVTIPTAGQNVDNGISTTFQATNGYTFDTVTIYRQANAHTGTTYNYNISCDFHDYSQGDLLPATGGQYRIDYVSQVTPTEVYTSGSYPGTTQSLTSSVSADHNCSIVGGISTVSGTGYYYISVGANSGGSRYVQTSVTYDADHYDTVGLWQDANAASIAAELYPYVSPTTGTIYLILEIASADLSKVTWPVSVNDVTLGITVTGQSETTATVFPLPLSFPQPPSLTPRKSTVELTRMVQRPQGESGTMRVIKTTNAPTSDQVTDFTCDSKSYSVMSQI